MMTKRPTLALTSRRLARIALLLAGVATNSVCSALILLVHGLSSMSQSFTISRWLIGSLDAIEFQTLVIYLAAVVLFGVVIVGQARQWNLLAIGEAWAATRGAGPDENTRADSATALSARTSFEYFMG